MNIESVLYLINLVKNLDIAIGIVLVTSFIFILITLIITGLNHAGSYGDDEYKDSHLCAFINFIRKNIKWLILLLSVSCIFPSERTMYLMIGANYFKNSNIPPKIELIIEKKLDEYLLEPVKSISKDK